VTRRLVSFSVWSALLFLLWLVLVGTVTPLELYAGASAAVIGATASELVRSSCLPGFRVELGWLARVRRPLVQIVPDFAFLAVALARTIAGRRAPAGTYLTVGYAGGDARSAGWRALATAAGSLGYFTSVSSLNIGRYIERMIVPTMIPTPIIMIGSMIEVSAEIEASTSSS
jgi:hypothetical protein